jgi:hypothetical protein
MAISQAMTTSFKAEIMLGVHDFRASGGDTFKLALYTSSATLGAGTTAYTTSNEVSGVGYTAGGGTLSNLGVSTSGTTAFTDFSDLTFPNATITARGALIYNTTPSANDNSGSSLTNPAVAVLDFGSDKSSSDGDFTIIFPSPTASTAIIRIA